MGKTNPITISLCMIVKDEENALGQCLQSVAHIVDEIIIVDTGSIDRTKEIAKEFTNCIYDFEWINNFSAARNYAFSKATKEYVLWLDADDIITEENQKKLLTLKNTLNKEIDAVTMDYHLTFDADGNPEFSTRRNRLVKREKQFKWHGIVHEYLEVFGNIKKSDIAITHKKEKEHSDRNIRIYEQALKAGETFSPRDQYYYANECLDHGEYENAIKWYQKFLKGKKGWSEDKIVACGKLADCYVHQKNWANAISSCINAFHYDGPRGEICCRLGYIYLQKNDVRRAISWYKVATSVPIPQQSPFVNHSCYTWLPHLQLCVCYHRLGEVKEAEKHNEIAATFAPNNSMVKHNLKYFQSLKQEDGQ